MGFSKQEYWSGLAFLSPGDLLDLRIEPSPALAGGFFTTEPPGKPFMVKGADANVFYSGKHQDQDSPLLNLSSLP